MGYATGRLQRALERALVAEDPAVRRRAAARVDAWREALDAMTSGRTAPGETERLNLRYLGDEGLAELGQALRTGRYRVDVPEDSALLVVAWLLEHGHDAAALDLVAELRPLMHRLRFTPAWSTTPSGAVVRRNTVDEVRAQLRQATVRPQIAATRETLQVWNPLYDRLVALWCDTVDGDLPYLTDGAVEGGWPCRVWPDDWVERRRRWLEDYKLAAELHQPRPWRSNFTRLRMALELCPDDSSALDGRAVGWIRRALANTISARGTPGSADREALRRSQREAAAQPAYATLAHVLSARLDAFPRAGGLPELAPIAGPVDCTEAPAAAGAAIPAHLLAKAARALEAPIGELVERGVIGSGEVLAEVIPQVTAQLLAANIGDPALALVYAQTCAAFRRRLDLGYAGPQFGELPWVDAIVPYRDHSPHATRAAVQTLRETTTVALGAFPERVLPNQLVREFGELAATAGLQLPLVEDVAGFTGTWRAAAVVTSRVLAGSLYARYYDLPADWPTTRIRWRRADDFVEACNRRAAGANGAMLEQSHILTTRNLAVLVDALDLTDWLREAAPELADRAFAWALRQPASSKGLKGAASAWRQGIFYLSYCDPGRTLGGLRRPAHLEAAVTGLLEVASGKRFDAAGRTSNGGRRLLGSVRIATPAGA
ncbi:hypothetical protein JOF29_008467 [Kribbella aluminosa]|uniref:Uncharacterized protein n=1 Tax=Kribbella aluminosa TaxID=416017 RepID=A0ABS4V0D2_9ACTN|nr:hypothetical protein [Kribbella aluminosa]MBP2357357.1 hypothetical protein [Kribbella aluminosa]